MDLRQIEYIVKIAEEGGITSAAEKLFITQSALNQQLLKLEDELGVQLFHRRKHDFRPTDAGEVYIKYGREILQKKQEAYNIIYDMAANNLGHLNVAFSPERGTEMFVSIYADFHKQFPHITINPTEMNVRQQQSQLVKGYLDLGFVTITDVDKLPTLEYEHIIDEPLLLAVPRSHSLAINQAKPDTPPSQLPYHNLQLFKEQPFVLMFKNSTMRSVIDSLFKNAGFTPNILFETASNRTLCTMAKNNICCTIVPQQYYRNTNEVAFYRLPSNPHWELCNVYKKGSYRTKASQLFAQLTKNYFLRLAHDQ